MKVFLVEDEIIMREGIISTGRRKGLSLSARQVMVSWHTL